MGARYGEPGTRPLVLAVHGAVANAQTWIPLRRVLGDTCELRAADLPGHGTRRAEAFGLERAIAELTQLTLGEAPRRRVFLAGDSLGGYLALAAAARAGAAVAGVIAGSCTYPMRGLPALLARASLAGDVVTAQWPFELLVRRFARPDVAAAILAAGFAPRMRGTTLRALLGRDVLADIRAIDAPVIFVDGRWDLPIVCYAAHFARTARRGSFRIVAGAGHGVGFTHPEAFADAVRACMAFARPGSTP